MRCVLDGEDEVVCFFELTLCSRSSRGKASSVLGGFIGIIRSTQRMLILGLQGYPVGW